MTNRELLNAPKERLGPVDRQRQHILRGELAPMPCPACLRPLDALTAAGGDIDSYRFSADTPVYHCPDCGAVLDRVVPIFAIGPGWHWQLNHSWLADRLRKARLYDEQHKEK
ncbi:MAG: hypothetical protein U0840_28610 [Gemmataceae bacterium]